MEADDAIAIVGVACNFPGAPDLDAYWRILVNGENHVKEIPPERWNNEAFYSNDRNEPGKSYVKHAAFIERFKEWDNKFFGINDEEAKRMDPQQHLLLECVYKAMENGGFPIDRVTGSDVGCFIGLMNEDYGVVANSDIKDTSNYTVTGDCSMAVCGGVNFMISPDMFVILSRARMLSLMVNVNPSQMMEMVMQEERAVE
ncbi:putative uncharacterized protein encoded by LINC00614 [Ptychodera flava]|uniref:putative uncharacterized protein encoded by LINC00614 n=1 Tax=Ptychodera flava TaxID=63121 RepID=UPI00396AAE2F